jgi:hypothetical protein
LKIIFDSFDFSEPRKIPRESYGVPDLEPDARYRKWSPSGRKNGAEWELSPLATSSVVTKVGDLPMPILARGANGHGKHDDAGRFHEPPIAPS